MNLKKLFLLIGVLLFIIGGFLGYNFYNKLYKPNTSTEGYVYIPTNSSYDDVENLLRPFLNRVNTFAFTATIKNYKNAVKPGKYHISKEMNNNQLVNLLKSGRQTTVKLSFNNQDTFEKLAGRIAEQIEADSLTLLNSFKDKNFLAEAGFIEETSLGMYIPNTYEFYWNTSAELFRKKMLREYQNFWNQERLEKAKRLNLDKNQVITLASIVQKETANVRERPRVAGLYLNRLKDKWPLQADPTVIFALKKQAGNEDIVIKRVLKKDLDIDSPYNTYKNLDLPPGLISMPDISSIDAVLNYEKHDFYYMCASISNIGTHEFAKTLSQHNRNAAIYQKWLNQQGVNR
ncbi:endolytic transglycosylase MltG [Lutibacter sp. HS1-25]|uniref:endolytic transglycosylase MltG n=1 Tax=Lutibacter sp. HS1-25 TaxID=2485000 RepID=UPI0010116028|nr:endolytic transglycosylase MltG [Lutibacter sp. HS1-25]RXP63510.1 endolytic transglycosylase MltG [Lutibacter sp. HS1-25]